MGYGAVGRGRFKEGSSAFTGFIWLLFQALEVPVLECGHLAFLTVHFLAERNQILLPKIETLQVCQQHGCIWILYVSEFMLKCVWIQKRMHTFVPAVELSLHIFTPACNLTPKICPLDEPEMLLLSSTSSGSTVLSLCHWKLREVAE